MFDGFTGDALEIRGLIAKPFTGRKCPHCGNDPNFPRFPLGIPVVISALCPYCNKYGEVKVCYGCKRIMCVDCLTEHQVGCLHKKTQ